MSIGKNTLSNIIGTTLPMIVALLTVPIYLRYIGTERYGVLAVIWGLLGYFGFMDFGFGRAVTQRMAKLSNASNSEVSNMLWTALVTTFVLGLVGSFGLWMSADYILNHLVTMSESSRIEMLSAVNWMLLFLPLLLPTSVLQGAMQARFRFNELNVIQVLGSTLSQLIPLAVATSGCVGLASLVPAALAARLVTGSLLVHLSCRHVPLYGKPVFEFSHFKPLVNYGGWISVMTLLAPLLVTVDRIVIATLSGARAVTYYTIPYDLVSKATIISCSLSNAIFPRLASVNAERAKDMSFRATSILVAVMTPVVIIGQCVVQPFLNLWVGRHFAKDCSGVGELILAGIWLNAVVIPHHARLLAMDNPKIVVIVYLVEIPVYFMLLWYGVTHFGVLGTAAAWSLRVLMDTVMLLYVADALKATIQTIKSSLAIVVAYTFVVLATSEDSHLRWGIGLLFILISVIKDKELLINIFLAFRYKKGVAV